MQSFKALLIEETDGKVDGAFATLDETQLDPGAVTIRVAYSSVNYKDALAATGAGKIIRRFPCIGGIDLSGIVIESVDPRFRTGDAVIATSFDIGVAHHGGYSEIARVPGDWVVPLPAGLSLFEAMALGTAGFTAALAVVRMEENRLAPGNGPVIVTGSTGGVGSLAVDILAKRGYHVVARRARRIICVAWAPPRSCCAALSICRKSVRLTRRAGLVRSTTWAAMFWRGLSARWHRAGRSRVSGWPPACP